MFIWRASNKDQPQVPKHVQVFAMRSAAEKQKKKLTLSFYTVTFRWNNKGLMSELDGAWEKLKEWIQSWRGDSYGNFLVMSAY